MQLTLRVHCHPHPRGKALKEFLDSLRRSEVKRKRTAYEDRGKGTPLDGYNQGELVKMSDVLLRENRAKSLRTRVDVLLAHHIVCRGETIRKVMK